MRLFTYVQNPIFFSHRYVSAVSERGQEGGACLQLSSEVLPGFGSAHRASDGGRGAGGAGRQMGAVREFVPGCGTHTHTYAVMCACGGRARGVGGMGSYWTRQEKWGTYYYYGEVRAYVVGSGGWQ